MFAWIMNVGVLANNIPSLHPEFLIRLWYRSPFTQFEPHAVTAFFLLVVGMGIGYFRSVSRKRKVVEDNWKLDSEEKKFQDLLAKKNMTLQKLLKLEAAYEQSVLTEEEFNRRAAEYKAYLYKIKKQLNQFID